MERDSLDIFLGLKEDSSSDGDVEGLLLNRGRVPLPDLEGHILLEDDQPVGKIGIHNEGGGLDRRRGSGISLEYDYSSLDEALARDDLPALYVDEVHRELLLELLIGHTGPIDLGELFDVDLNASLEAHLLHLKGDGRSLLGAKLERILAVGKHQLGVYLGLDLSYILQTNLLLPYVDGDGLGTSILVLEVEFEVGITGH